MSAEIDRMNAAAEKIEKAVEEQGLPWVSEPDSLGQHDHALFDVEGFFSGETDHGPLIAMAVNAMPAVAKWLRDHTAEHSAYECGWEPPCAAVSLADQILGAARGAR